MNINTDRITNQTTVSDERSYSEQNYIQDKWQEDIWKTRTENRTRQSYGDIILNFTVIWLAAILIIFIWVGLGKLHYSDSVLITMLTTTTATAVGFLVIVFNYLYNRNKIS